MNSFIILFLTLHLENINKPMHVHTGTITGAFLKHVVLILISHWSKK